MPYDVHDSVKSVLIEWVNLLGSSDDSELPPCVEFSQFYRQHLPLLLYLCSNAQDYTECSSPKMFFDQAFSYLHSKGDGKDTYVHSLDFDAAADGNEFEIAKVICVLTVELALCRKDFVQAKALKMDRYGGSSINLFPVLMNRVLVATKADMEDLDEAWRTALLMPFEIEGTATCTDSDMMFAQPQMPQGNTRRSTLATASQLHQTPKGHGRVSLNQSIYCTPSAASAQISRRTVARTQFAAQPSKTPPRSSPNTPVPKPQPGSPSAAVIDFVSSPMMKEKRALRENQQLRLKINEHQDTINSQALELGEFKKAVSVLTEKLDSLRMEIGDKNGDVELQRSIVAAKEKELSEQQKQLEQVTKELSASKESQKRKNDRLVELEMAQGQADALAEDLKAQKKDFEKRFRDLRQEAEVSSQRLLDTEKVLASVQNEIEARSAELLEYKDMYNQLRESSRQTLAAKEEEYIEMLANAQATSASNHENFTSLCKERDDLLVEVEAHKLALKNARSDHRLQLEQLKSISTQEKDQLQKKLQRAEEQLKESESLLSTTSAERHNMEVALRTANLEKTRLAGELADCQQNIQETNAKTQEYLRKEEEVMVQLAEAEHFHVRLTEYHAKAEEKILGLFGDKERLQIELAAMKEKYDAEFLETDALRNKIASKEEELANKKAAFEEKEKEIASLIEKLRELEENRATSTERYEALYSTVEELHKQIVTVKTEQEANVSSYRNEIDMITKKAADAEKRNGELGNVEVVLVNLREENETLKRTLKDDKFRYEAFIESLQAKNSSLESKLRTLEDEKEKLQSHIDKVSLSGSMVSLPTMEPSSSLSNARGQNSNSRLPLHTLREDLDFEEEPIDSMEMRTLEGNYITVEGADQPRRHSQQPAALNATAHLPGARAPETAPRSLARSSRDTSTFQNPLRVPSSDTSIGWVESTPRTVTYKGTSDERLRKMHETNMSLPPHLRCSYAVETAHMSPKFEEDALRNDPNFVPISVKKEALDVSENKKATSISTRMKRRVSSVLNKKPLNEKN